MTITIIAAATTYRAFMIFYVLNISLLIITTTLWGVEVSPPFYRCGYEGPERVVSEKSGGLTSGLTPEPGLVESTLCQESA